MRLNYSSTQHKPQLAILRDSLFLPSFLPSVLSFFHFLTKSWTLLKDSAVHRCARAIELALWSKMENEGGSKQEFTARVFIILWILTSPQTAPIVDFSESSSVPRGLLFICERWWASSYLAGNRTDFPVSACSFLCDVLFFYFCHYSINFSCLCLSLFFKISLARNISV